MEKTKILPLYKKRFNELSGGEKQRVIIERNLKIYKASFQSAIGTIYYLWVRSDRRKEADDEIGGQVKLSYLGNRKGLFENYVEKLKENSFMKDLFPVQDKKSAEIENHILDYLSGKVKNIKLDTYFLFGTNFEKKVWNTVVSIPYGKTLSYKELAEKTGCPLAWRAVGTALGHNPVMLVVPCHRIIRSDGSIGNFGGGVKVKEFLLNLEGLNRY
ncbi:MAG: methylated-DNA--[protein]-cysteine S-methyltransferase [Actinobacteria bacterium]|nr:methylated-DNA--[protein]-cysteine S-methyltransferase [Actinomycetota bacterium]